MGALKRETIFMGVFAAFALAAAVCGAVQLPGASPQSWTLVITVIVGVIICSPLQFNVGRDASFPLVGVSIVMLTIPPFEQRPWLSVCVWIIGLGISQLLIRRIALHALYLTGLSGAAAAGFMLIRVWLEAFGVWEGVAFLSGTALYYGIFVLGELARRSLQQADANVLARSAPLSFGRLALVTLAVTTASILMRSIDRNLIPWLEQNSELTRSPFVVLFTALMCYVLAQRLRAIEGKRRLDAVVASAVELPQESGAKLALALQNRACDLVRASHAEVRDTAPERGEIGARVVLQPGCEQFLIATRKVGGTAFSREDDRALASLAHLASEAARIQHEVNSLERRANTDPLTGLPNYGAFQKALVHANEFRLYHEGIALLFIDLDNFKRLNDTHGHRTGDELLREVARRLERTAGGGDFVSRVGGDEFVVILAGLVSIEHAKESAERIIAAVSERVSLEGEDIRPAVSAGLAFSHHRELDAQTLVEDADRTMLQAKRSRHENGASGGGSSVSVSSRRSTRTNDIVARAIQSQRLNLAFQPIVRLDTSRVWGFEALVRYVDPELGPISPPSLVARAKSLGLMNELTCQVISKALTTATEFVRINPELDTITVNLELTQISEDQLGPFIREAAAAHPEVKLCIELNERSLRDVTDELRRDAERLQRAGIIIALDDYGSDDSSVGALVHFPMNILKIDKSLISNLDDVRQREVVKALQGFGDSLGRTTVVEGVEDAQMAAVLAELGVSNAQGYFYGRPISAALTIARIRRWGTQAVTTA
ncbi:putative bifunctional diguanylate cyclase/phosphodiesterase [Leucobacter chromiireducens]|nr:bifunctional diguanylate cyclase/phosphodiesterase [Leucobacter chromiireducens]